MKGKGRNRRKPSRPLRIGVRKKGHRNLELPLSHPVEEFHRQPQGNFVERRQFHRFPYVDPVVVRRKWGQTLGDIMTPGPVVLGRGLDLSQSGMGLAIAEAFTPGDELILSFHPYPTLSAEIVRLICKVRHVRLQQGELWIIGCSFDDILSLDTEM